MRKKLNKEKEKIGKKERRKKVKKKKNGEKSNVRRIYDFR